MSWLLDGDEPTTMFAVTAAAAVAAPVDADALATRVRDSERAEQKKSKRLARSYVYSGAPRAWSEDPRTKEEYPKQAERGLVRLRLLALAIVEQINSSSGSRSWRRLRGIEDASWHRRGNREKKTESH